MKSLAKYQEIAENYINGNISDFRTQLAKLSKKEVLVLEWQMKNSFGIEDANNVIWRYL